MPAANLHPGSSFDLLIVTESVGVHGVDGRSVNHEGRERGRVDIICRALFKLREGGGCCIFLFHKVI